MLASTSLIYSIPSLTYNQYFAFSGSRSLSSHRLLLEPPCFYWYRLGAIRHHC
jgi:hypothetical protein